MGADEIGSDDQHDAVERDPAREKLALLTGVVAGEGKKKWGASQGVHDWEECSQNE